MRRAGVASLLFLPAFGLALAAQNPATFRAGTEPIEVGAIVVDARGHPAAGLTKNDFSIEEDGRPTAVSTFAAVDADLPEQRKSIVCIGRAGLFDIHVSSAAPPRLPDGLGGATYHGTLGFAGDTGGRAFVNLKKAQNY
jgi:hypothetical protein